MREVDYLIVGQGLAGTLIANQLIKANQKILVFDPNRTNTATKVAAGLVNPITGRRYVKSWKIDELLPKVKATYREMEEILGISLIKNRHIIRALLSIKEQNDWLSRCQDDHYQDYILDQAQLGEYEQALTSAFAYGEVRGGFQVDIGKLIKHYRTYLQTKDSLEAVELDYRALKIGNAIGYKDSIVAKGIIFCDGVGMKKNPFFNYLPMYGDKGEALIIKADRVNFSKCLKQRIFIIPLGEHYYWIGATYIKDYKTNLPTEKGKSFLVDQLHSLLQVPFEVVEHKAAVRPTVKDRRPLVGRHPEFQNLFLFNGLGTKGTSLGPFFAEQFTNFLLKETQLDPAVDLNRFSKKD